MTLFEDAKTVIVVRMDHCVRKIPVQKVLSFAIVVQPLGTLQGCFVNTKQRLLVNLNKNLQVAFFVQIKELVLSTLVVEHHSGNAIV